MVAYIKCGAVFLVLSMKAFMQVHCITPKYKSKFEDHISSRVSELLYALYIYMTTYLWHVGHEVLQLSTPNRCP